MRHVTRWPKLLSVGVLGTVAVGGVAAVAFVPGGPASKTALGLGAVAIVIAAGNYAESPDWDEMEKDVKRLREIADGLPAAPVDSSRLGSHRSNHSSALCWLVLGLVIVLMCPGRSLKKLKKRRPCYTSENR
jgi:hypothetical protein